MSAVKSRPAGAARLRASPTFSLAHTLDGRPYVAQETEPYLQFWLSERYRVLWSMFAGRNGATLADAIAGALRLTQPADDATERRHLHKAARDMLTAGVLVDCGDDSSRYDARIAPAYVAHRPFPRELSAALIQAAGVGRASRVLDLAGGPGDLALALAEASDDVTLMDLSRGFLAAARARARRRGLKLATLHESCNRLMFQDDALDLVTVSQALHWLDDVQVCRGVCRLLRPGGSFVVVHSAIEVADDHPLAYVLGHDSVLGRKRRQAFAAEVQPLWRRLSLLFDALDAPEVDRHDPSQQGNAADGAGAQRIAPAAVSLYRQQRPIDEGFARAFLTDRHIERTGQAPAAFWQDLSGRLAGVAPDQLQGRMHWALLHFRRQPASVVVPPLARLPVIDIGWHGPATA